MTDLIGAEDAKMMMILITVVVCIGVFLFF